MTEPWLENGAVVGAMTHNGGTVHAGQVHALFEGSRCYSMGALCVRYRKANGERPVYFERHGHPMLVRNLHALFAEIRSGEKRLPWKTCRWCVAVFDSYGGDVPVPTPVPAHVLSDQPGDDR